MLGLIIITLCAALPIKPQGPFDARDNRRLAGMRLTQSGWGVFIEPLTAPLHIVAGAPDLRVAGVAVLSWVICGAAAWRVALDRRTQASRPVALRALRAAVTGGGAGMVMLYCVGFAGIVRVPGWRLVVDNPGALILDPHSHTVASHDGLVSGPENLDWHSAAGFNVVAITEHNPPAGAFATMDYARTALPPVPAVITGVELSFNNRGVSLLGLGLRSDYRPLANSYAKDFPSQFTSYIHNDQHGAVIAMGYKLEREDVTLLADAGIDGFELVNFGHPDVSNRIREKLVEVATQRGLALVAVSDWHGWGGISRTWTVMDHQPIAGSPAEHPSDLAVRNLRERHQGDIIPVVAGYIGPPSWWRVVLSPFVESLRYAAELSPARVASWWIWSALVLALSGGISRVGLPPHKVLLAILLAVIGAGIAWAGMGLIAAGENKLSTSDFPARIGVYTLLVGTSAMLTAVWLGMTIRLDRVRTSGGNRTPR